jgi:tetratricopeptide (TPR) repeat protein
MRRLVSQVVVILVLLSTANASAADPAELALAQKLFHEGRSLYQAGQFGDAAEKFRAALRIATRPSIVLGLAQCYRQLKNAEEGLKAYKQYAELWAKLNPNRASPYDKEVKSLIAELSQVVKENETRELKRKEEAAKRAQAKKEEAEKKRKAEEERKATERARVAETATSEKEGPVGQSGAATVDAEKRRSKTIWAYASLAIGGAAILTGGVLLGVGYSQGNSAYDKYMGAGDPATISLLRNDVDDARPLLTASYAMFGVGAAALGFSIYQFVTRPAEATLPSQGSNGLSIAVGPGGGNLLFRGRF